MANWEYYIEGVVDTLDILFPYEVSHWHLMSTWEEHFMEGFIGAHLVHEERLSHGGVTKEGGEELQPTLTFTVS